MSKIRVLPDSLANKIAAGEVVERPASIVKELLENSLDAGAQRIEVAIESGGRRLIRLADDGEGMSRDDAILAFERHATSKLKTAEDLDAITTLGFRGEALASIASVAKVRLRTQTQTDLAGTEIEISGGRMLNVRDIAFARGAEFEIRDLFFNVPARRKFLKSEATENFHIANLVTHYALANPQLSFTLINNGRESIRVTPVNDLRERAYQLFGGDFISGLIEVRAAENSGIGELGVRGFVSSPSATRTTRDSQYFFINGRYVRDKVLSRALLEAYRAMIPSGVYPSAMLFVELPPHEVDVNVHPAKTEVRFVRSTIVHDLVRDAIRSAIGTTKSAVTLFAEKKQPAPEQLNAEARTAALDSFLSEQAPKPTRTELREGFRLQMPQPPAPPPAPQQQKIDLSFASAPAPVIEVEEAAGAATEPILHPPTAGEQPPTDNGETPTANRQLPTANSVLHYSNRLGCLGARGADNSNAQLKTAQNLTLHFDEINIGGQLHNSFILASDRTGLLIIDQHVAHERILFEQHWRNLRNRKIEVQRLLIPETLDLTPAQAAAFDQVLPELEANGFELGRLSGRTIALKAIPAILGAGTAQTLLLELLDAIEQDRKGLSLDELHAEIAASLACRAAIKINMPLAPAKMRWLLDELLRMENPATCPHGRPIILRMTMREIERGFQRS
ncbi:MAG: DNA mismatch repair endonuclease MutL [Acidobacteria bacterium]|nr:DNA mismatch repair endonuclease MutL [Acidobacteriota bacterium]MBI3428359.1 DNA mismatch repair endonuclease MutL [Acidobacteriota bacterium]